LSLVFEDNERQNGCTLDLDQYFSMSRVNVTSRVSVTTVKMIKMTVSSLGFSMFGTI